MRAAACSSVLSITPSSTMPKISEGDRLPLDAIKLKGLEGCDAKDFTGEQLFAGKRVALFAVPGAFTPSCSDEHLPGYLSKYEEIKAKGVDSILCVASNDCFVTKAWAQDKKTDGKVTVLADGDVSFGKLLDLTVDSGEFGGLRLRRFSALVDDGVVKKLNLEDGGGYSGVSGADQMLKDITTVYGQE